MQSKNGSFYKSQYFDVLKNQLIKAHYHSLLVIALKFEQYQQKDSFINDLIWFINKAAENLSVFRDQLQGVSNLPEGDISITAIDFDY